MQKLLVAGRKKEALQCAKEGYLWGPALVLASQLGDQVLASMFYIFLACLLYLLGQVYSWSFTSKDV